MSIEGDLISLHQVKAQIDAMLASKEAIEDRLVEQMRKQNIKTATATSAAGADIKGTLVEGTRVIIDEEKLKKSLGATLWKKVTKTVLDKEKLEARVTTGDIDRQVVAAASEVKDNKPYIRMSAGKPAAPNLPSTTRKVKPRKKSAAAKKVKP